MRLAVSAVLLGLLVFAGSRWFRPLPPEPSSAKPTARDFPEPAPPDPLPAASPSPAALTPEAEAAALKQEAVTAAEEVAKDYPNEALTYALLGSAFYNTGRSDEASKHLKKCLELQPGMVDAYEILARVAYEKGEPEDTVRLCQEALKRGPATPAILNRLGRALIDLGRADEAARTLERAVLLPSPASESFYLLGQAHMQGGQPAQAKEGFRQAIHLTPDHTQAYFGMYTACQRLGETEEAERYLEQFRKLEAADRKQLTDRSAQADTLTGLPMVRETVARTLFGAAQIYRVQGQNARAAALFRRSAALHADNPMYRAALEAFYLEQKDLAGGVTAFKELAAEQPTNALNYFFLGRLQARLEGLEAAERSYLKVQELTPQWAEGHRALAELYLMASRKFDQARAAAQRAVDLEPTGPHYYLLAVACAKNNDQAGALEAARKAVALSPEEIRYQQFLEQLQPSRQP